MNNTVGKREWIGRALTVLAVLPFLPSAFFKFNGGPQIVEGMAHLGFPLNLVMPLGFLEVTCVILYLIPKTSFLGAILLTGYLGGAICTHLRVGDPFLVQIVLGFAVWGGLYLRDRRLGELLPFRR